MDSLIDLDMDETEAEALLTDESEEPETVSRETEPEPAADPDAPFGRFKNGKPRKNPTRKSRRAPSAPAGPRRPVPPARKPARKTATQRPDYQTLCREAIAVPEGILTVAAASRKSETLAADALTVSMYADALAEFGAEMAESEPRFAAMLEGIAKKSPWAKGLLIVIPFALQLGANHGRIPPIESLGVVSRETLLKPMKETTEQ